MNDEYEWLLLRLATACCNEQKLHEQFLRGKCTFNTWKIAEQEREKAVWLVRAANGEV